MRLTVQKARLWALIMALCLLLSGCRMRTTVPRTARDELRADEDGKSPSADGTGAAPQGESGDTEGDAAGADALTREDPEAARKQYDERAAAEIIAGLDRQIHGEGEGQGRPNRDDEIEARESILDDEAVETATQLIAAEQAERKGTDPDADEADSVLQYYTALLSERTRSLFECQRLTVYWETSEDYVTIYKKSPEHQLIIGAGAYDVSERLLEENLRVDDGWIARKNPGVIVKVVPNGASMDAAFRALARREGWSDIDAVRTGRTVILSEAMLESPTLQLAAMLVIAKTANGDLYEDVDLQKALDALMEEATGAPPSEALFFRGGT